MATNSPRVSICLPVFNGESFLPAAIESVLTQTFSDFELIIVDDCSTDQSLQIIESYARQDKRIKYLSNGEKKGLFGNYNRCLHAASGQYIKPFAQDDILQADMVRRLVELMDANPEIALASTARTPICDRGARITVASAPHPAASDFVPPASILSGRKVIKKAINPVVNFIGEPTTVIFRQEHVGSGFDPQYYHLGDLEYWFRILLKGRYFYLDEELCSFRVHTNSTSTTNHKYLLYALDLLKLGRKYKRFIWEAGGTQAQFNDNVVRGVALDLNARGDEFVSGLLDMDPDYLCQFDEYTGRQSLQSLPAGLFELALQALIRVPEPESLPSLDKQALQERQERQSIVCQLECTLQNYLSSPSWRSTRLLRELNQSLLDQGDESQSSVSDGQIDYERYLRKQIWRVRHSRSWKLTLPLRIADRWLNAGLSRSLPPAPAP